METKVSVVLPPPDPQAQPPFSVTLVAAPLWRKSQPFALTVTSLALPPDCMHNLPPSSTTAPEAMPLLYTSTRAPPLTTVSEALP